MVRIERGLAQSGEMFAAAEDSGIAQSAQKLARVDNHLFRIVRDRPRTHHRARRLEGQIEHRGKIHVEAKRAAVFADHATMLAKKRAAARGKNLCRRRRRTDHVAETVHRAAFKVHASEKRRGHALLAFAQKSMRLLSSGDVAGKQNHARRLNLREQGSEARRHLGPVEADDEELADFQIRIVHFCF